MTSPTKIRLKLAGALEGNTSMTIKVVPGVGLRWHEQGVEIVKGTETTLVPWSSLGSVTYKTEAPKQLEPTQPALEPTSADPRTSAAAKRARATARRPTSP